MISVLRGFGFFRSWKNASGYDVVHAEELLWPAAYKPFELYSLLSS